MIVKIEELLAVDNQAHYLECSDDYFIQTNNLVLEKLYIFELRVNQNNPFKLFKTGENSEKTMLFKLNRDYYFVSINSENYYKCHRSPIYQLSINDTLLTEFLEQKNIKNHIPLPIEIHCEKIKNPRHSGIYMYANELDKHEYNSLARLITQDFKGPHATCYIDFYPQHYANAYEIIEKQYLEKQIANNQMIGSSKKI